MRTELPLYRDPVNPENPIVYLDIAIGAEQGTIFFHQLSHNAIGAIIIFNDVHCFSFLDAFASMQSDE